MTNGPTPGGDTYRHFSKLYEEDIRVLVVTLNDREYMGTIAGHDDYGFTLLQQNRRTVIIPWSAVGSIEPY